MTNLKSEQELREQVTALVRSTSLISFTDQKIDEITAFVLSKMAEQRKEMAERVLYQTKHCEDCVCSDPDHDNEHEECYKEACVKFDCPCHKVLERVLSIINQNQ